MDHYVRGIGEKFHWRDVLKTLEAQQTQTRPATDEQQQSGGAPRP